MKINLSVIDRFFFCLSVCFFLAVANSLAQTSYLIVPGVKVGPINKQTTEAELKRIYGQQNVKDTEVDIGEGETLPGTVIFPNDPQRMIEIVWKDQKGKSSPESVHINSEQSLWKTKEGIGLGTSLKELERINGGGFTLYGFLWDYSGAISNWKNGRLAKRFGHRKLFLILNPDYDRALQKDINAVIGDGAYSSKNKAMQRLNPRVTTMIVTFP